MSCYRVKIRHDTSTKTDDHITYRVGKNSKKHQTP